MPEVSRFFGIIIRLFYSDHSPPHFHARYGSRLAQFEIATGRLMSGSLPAKQHRLVLRWLGLHRAELAANWHRARNLLPPRRIKPLG